MANVEPAAAHASRRAHGTSALGAMEVHAFFLVSPRVRLLSRDAGLGVPSRLVGGRPEAPLGRDSLSSFVCDDLDCLKGSGRALWTQSIHGRAGTGS